MTTISGFAEGILDGTIPPDREREYLKVISSETKRLSRLVRKMLDLSRLQSTEYVTPQEQFDVSEVMLRVLVSLETKINGKHLDVDTQLPDDPVQVWGDPDAITQVCYNLLDNAIKFSYEESTLGITVTTRAGKAYVSVRNHGDTIPPDELPLGFDRFHKKRGPGGRGPGALYCQDCPQQPPRKHHRDQCGRGDRVHLHADAGVGGRRAGCFRDPAEQGCGASRHKRFGRRPKPCRRGN